MTRLEFPAIGRLHGSSGHHTLRGAAALIAAVAGACAVMLGVFVIVGSVSVADATWAFVAIAVLGTVWLSGLWWRADAPDARDPHFERERRGF